MKKRLYIGTSGFSYSDWRGLFYPESVKPKEYLEYYSTQFNAVELNASFYHLPKKVVVEGWYKRTPPHFRFCPKLSRLITHTKKLHEPELNLYTFFKVFEPLEEKLGPVLVQLPPTLTLQAAHVRPFFKILRERYSQYSFAIEARHNSWIAEEAYQLLEEFGLNWVIADSGGLYPSAIVATGKLAYFRFHGPTTLYASEYPLKAMQEYAQVARAFLTHKKAVWAFFNNDVNAYAIHNARQLRHLL